MGQPRGTQRYRPTQREDEDRLTQAIIQLASQYGRYGYRRIAALLLCAGWQVGKDRVERIWRREGLKVPKKQKPRGRLWLNDGSCVRLRPTHENHVWSYDFMSARTHDGRSARILNLIDEHTRECLLRLLEPLSLMAKSMEKQLSPFVGEPVETKKLDQDMMTIVGQGRFATATYSMMEKNGEQGLLVQAEQKSYAPPIVRPLILIDGSEYNNVLFSTGARIAFLDVGSYRSELRIDIVLGSQYRFASAYFHPLTTTSNWFIAPRFGLNSQQLNIYSSNTLQAS